MGESLPPPRKPTRPQRPVDIVFEGLSVPPAPEVPTASRTSRNSLYHVQKALLSPRVLAFVVGVSGYVWAGAQYVAGSARQADLDKAEHRIEKLEEKLAGYDELVINANAALTGAQQCTQQLGAQALATRAIVGQIARQRGRTEHQKRNEQAAAESRYNTAVADGKPPHEAARIALYDQ